MGTMNNPGTVLMTVADMSIIQAEIEVDETDIVDVRLGQPAKVVIDALPDKEFEGHVTKIGSSALQVASEVPNKPRTSRWRSPSKAKCLEHVRAFLAPPISRPPRVTTLVSVPIQALTVREVTLDEKGEIVRERPTRRKTPKETAQDPDELPAGHKQ